MTRAHRLLHRRLWPILAFIVALGFVLALSLRPAEPGEARATPVEQPR